MITQSMVNENSKEPDIAMKNLFKNPDRFAELFNKIVFKEDLISPEDLLEREPSMEVIVRMADGSSSHLNKIGFLQCFGKAIPCVSLWLSREESICTNCA